MLKKNKQLLSVMISFLMCFTNLVSPVYAEEIISEEPETQESTAPENTEETILEEISEEDEALEEETATEPAEEEQSEPEKPEQPAETAEESEEIPEAEVYSDESDFKYSAGSTSVSVTGYTGTDTVLEVPDTINGLPVTAIGNNAFKGGAYTSVKLPSTVTSIGSNAFQNCSSLVSVNIPDGMTLIGTSAFSGCTSLISIRLPEGVTTIGNYTFQNCSSLADVDLPSGLTSIGSTAFQNCVSLTDVELPEGLKTIGSSAFAGCTGITKITIPSTVTSISSKAFSSLEEIVFAEGMTAVPGNACQDAAALTKAVLPSTVTSIGGSAFSGCSSLTSINIPDGVTSLGSYAFSSCTSLTDIILPEGLKTIAGNVFSGCTGLTKITIPSAVTSISGSAFPAVQEIIFAEGMTAIPNNACSNAKALTKVTIPSTVTSIGSNAFQNCTALTSAALPSGLTMINGSAFSGCSSLTSINIPDGVTSLGSYAFSSCTSLTNIILPEGLTTISNNAFAGCTGITKLTVPSTVTSIGSGAFPALQEIVFAEGMTTIPSSACNSASALTKVTIPSTVTGLGTYAFSGCKLLESVSLPAGLTTIGNNAFQNCSALSAVDLPSGVTYLGNYSFQNCTSLTNIILPEGLTTIGSNAFAGCTGITKLTIPSTVTSIGNGAFTVLQEIAFAEGMEAIPNSACYNASALTKVTIPSTVTSIGSSAFSGCKLLESVSLPAGLASIGNYAFQNCVQLTSIDLPEGLTTIGDNAFSGCTGITKATIPSTVTSMSNAFPALQEIIFAEGMKAIPNNACNNAASLTKAVIPSTVTNLGNYAFAGCKLLESITLPAGLTSIGNYAFQNCSALASVDLPAGLTSIGNYAFRNCALLTDIDLPEGLTTIGDNAFNGCTGITKITIPSTVITMSNAFPALQEIVFADGIKAIPNNACNNAASLTKATIPSTVETIGTYAFAGCKLLESVSLPAGLTNIGSSAFRNCVLLTEVSLPEGLTGIGDYTFNGCTGITKVTIPSTVTSIGSNAFNSLQEIIFAEGMKTIPNNACYSASALTKVTIPSTVETIGNYAFSGCKLLEEITLPSGVVSIGNYAFQNCTALGSVNIPDGVTRIGNYAFSYCTSLKEISIPSDCRIEANAFSNCTGLETVRIGDNVSLGNNVFSNCKAITRMELGKDVTYTSSTFPAITLSGQCGDDLTFEFDFVNREMTISGTGAMYDYSEESPAPWEGYITVPLIINFPEEMTSVGDHAFEGGRNLLFFNLPENVGRIGKYAFAGCETLTYIEIPETVSVIGEKAFAGCTELEQAVFCGNAPAMENVVFEDNSPDLVVYVPSDGTGWSASLGESIGVYGFEQFDDTVDSMSVLLLLDVSGSMDSRMAKLRESVNSFVKTVGGRINKTSICIVKYNSSAELVQDYITNVSQLKYYIDKLVSGGGTEYHNALTEANTYAAGGMADKNYIVMFSDGEPNDSVDPIYELADVIRETYTIFTVGLSPTNRGAEILKRIAGDSYHYFSADNISQLEQTFLQVGSDLERKEKSQFKMTRQNVVYDLLNEEVKFLAGSDEAVSLTILPSYLLGDYGEVWLEQNGEKVYQSTNGKFDYVQPGIGFIPGEPVYAVVYDPTNTQVLEKTLIRISIIDTVLVKYHLNYGNKDTIHTTQSVKIGSDFKAPNAPERTGYKFRGWYSNAKCSSIEWFSAQNTENRKNLSGNIDLYAKWTQFDPDFDAWRFSNSSDNFKADNSDARYEIRDGDWARLAELGAKNVSESTMQDIIEDRDAHWGGSCHGMSVSAVLLYDDYLDINGFQSNAVNVHDATIKKNSQPKDVGVIESLINFYQLRWRMSGIFDEDIHGRNSSESESIQQIINTMSAADGPCILNIRFPYTVTRPDGNSWTEYGYHTVVGYGFSQNSTQYSFKVYDPSRKDTVYTVKLFDQNGTYAKECSSWSSAWQKSKPRLSDDRVKNGYTATNFQGIELGSAFSGSDLCAPGILTQPSVLSEMQSLGNARDVYKLKTAYHAFTITDGTHSAVIIGGMKVSGDLEVTAYGNMNFYDQDPEYMFELPVLGDNGYYKIIPEEDGDSTTTLIYDSNTDGFYSRVETKTPGTFIFYADGTISTEFDEPAEQKITVLDSVMNTVWNKVILETTSSGITAKPYADKVTVVSDNETTMTVTAGSSLNSMTFENVPVSQKETVIKGDADGVCTIEYDGETVGTDVFGYSVVFDSRLGSTVDSLRNVPKGAKLEKPANPTREGYFFEGWYKDEQYKEAWDFDTDTVQGNIILYAAWNVDPNYFVTVTFRLPGDRTESVVVPNGYELTEEDCPVTAVGDQYVWYTDSGCTKAWTAGSAVTRNTVLYTFGWNVQDDSSLTVTPESLIMNAGDTKQLKAEGVTETVRWMSGDVNVATVDENGVVTAVAEGTTTIAAVTATGKAGYCTLEVCPEGIYVKGMQSEYTYTGAAIKPAVRVYDSGILLKEKTDYTLTYKNNTKAYALKEDDPGFNAKKAPQIIIKSNSKGNYKGSKTVYFTIDPVDLTDNSITADALSIQETGKPLSPVPALYFNGKKLKNNTDYTVDYTGWDRLTGDENNEAVITIRAKENGNFSGERKATVYIAPKGTTVPVSKLKVTAVVLKYEDLTEENFAEKVANAITVKDGKTELLNGINYTIKDIDPEDRAVGSFRVTLEGDGSKYIGERTVTVKITGIALTDKKIKAAVPSYEYTGEPQALGNDFSIKYNDEPLEAGKDYTVESYSNNINAGTATVVLKGLGRYTGTRKVTFKITPVDATGRDITVEDAYYTKGGSKPKVTVEGLSEGTDYTLKYANNKKVTDGSVSKWPTVTITFKGNYKGTVTRDFFIDPKPLDQVTITVADKVYSGKANAWKSVPVLTDTDGKKLKAGTDYDKNIIYTTEDGEELPAVVEPGTVVKVTITGKGSYIDKASATYRILGTDKDISKATFKIAGKEYTGSPVELSEDDILGIKIGRNELDLTLGTDYEIVGYTNNVKKGTAKVTFRGKGEYGGEKTVSFKIGQRDIGEFWNDVVSFFSRLF